MLNMSSRHYGHYDERGIWQREKFCFVYCGDRCDCGPPFGTFYSEAHDLRTKEAKMNEDEAKTAVMLIQKLLDENPTLKSITGVTAEVATERNRQNEKWGGAIHDDQHTTAHFADLLMAYASWAKAMHAMGSPDKARRRLIQVAALAVAAVESMDRKKAIVEAFQSSNP